VATEQEGGQSGSESDDQGAEHRSLLQLQAGVIFTESSGTAIEPDRAGHERLA